MGVDAGQFRVKIAVLVKQIPATDSLQLDTHGRLVRTGLALEMNPFCRRAASLGISLAQECCGKCIAFTLAPLAGEDVLREAVAAGADEGILISDPAFAGSDTLATARALATALRKQGPFDLILCGRNSVDADTGQVGPQVAQLLGMPFITSAKEVQLRNGELFAKSERDDGWMIVRAKLPLVLSAAERCCAPARAGIEARATVSSNHIRHLTANDLGAGPWGQAGSPTQVDGIRAVETTRHHVVLTGPLPSQVAEAVGLMSLYGAFASAPQRLAPPMASSTERRPGAPKVVVVLLEPGRGSLARELSAAGAVLARKLCGKTIALVSRTVPDWPAASWGIDELVVLAGTKAEESMAQAVSQWARMHEPDVILAPGTLWGREVAGRVAVCLNAGLIGDAVELDVSEDRVVAWKPAFGGRLLARITCDSFPQMMTLRPGAAPAACPQSGEAIISTMNLPARDRVRCIKRAYDDDADVLLSAHGVIGVGMGVAYDEYRLLAPLIEALDAPLACSRKVADRGWLPRTRQVGLTGHHIAPRLYVAIGLRGGFNHTVGIRRAGVVLAINSDKEAPVFADADIGIHADWREVVPLLARQIAGVRMKAGTRENILSGCAIV